VNWRDTFGTSVEAVRTHRLRSALTMLGILIGITAVILTVGLGKGAQADVRDQINELGTNVLVVSPGSSTDSSGVRGGFGSASTLTVQDADALANDTVAPDVEAVAATATSAVTLTVGDTNWTTTLTGTSSSWQDVRSREVTSGRFITAADEEEAAAVVVLGPDTASELFTGPNPVGQTVTLDGVQLEVVGVLESLTSSDDPSNNDVAIVPFSTMSQRLVGGTDRDSVDSIYVKATSADTLSAAYQETDAELANLHGITSADETDYSIATQESILEAATSVDQTLTVMLAGIAVIALLVGGIGVMNIMLVSVTERIREIGLRKALGARPRLIRRQFLVEASVLGLAGGILGVAAGIVGAIVLPHVSDSRVILSPTASLLAIVIAIAIGVAFGVYAAVQAGASSWKAFFFGSSDASNLITVDKSPAFLWPMALAARIFGVSSWSILAPQALEGVATVGVLYLAVRRWFGPAAGLLAGAVAALTPVAALMFRFNNPDSLLVLLLTLGAYAVVRAVESGSTRWIVWAGVFVGFGFLAKMLQAFLVVPAFGLVYLVAAPVALRTRLRQLALAAVAMVASAGWWVAIVELWPASSRPYIGGSRTNSVLELIFGYNGFGRLTGDEAGSVGGGPAGTTGRWGPTRHTRLFDTD
jgi:putative ABC transport system permease protein